MKRLRRGLASAGVALLLAGCATPTELIAARIDELGFTQTTLTGTTFHHWVAQAGQPTDRGAIHVYVDHDGSPWANPERVSTDPTPRHPLALELMARDGGQRVYLGRPCYFGRMSDTGCAPRMWTDERYSEEVVRSLAAVVNHIVDSQGKPAGVVLIGVSGGGTIAWLMAPHVPATTAVITVAANLDVKAWTSLHHYTPLTGSLDPATQAPLPPRIRQVHLVGGRDANVPPALVRPVALRQPQAQVVEIAEFDHVCCWLERWPVLLGAAIAGGAE
jgi:dienelactone hydrolase